MYEELVGDLRYCDKGDCNGCRRYTKDTRFCYDLLREAADAIEELQQTVKHYKGCSDDWYKEACDYKAMLPRWIPVTEQLPEPYVDVIATDGENVGVASYQVKGNYWLEDGLFDDTHIDVTHWMQLPEPPKEDV